MAERVRVRERGPGFREAAGYWVSMDRSRELLERGETGKVVISADDREWELGPMAYAYRWIYEGLHDDTALGNWWIFANNIRIHGGGHRHQGGLIIYVVEGSGYTEVDGVREEWEAGDLLLLPLRPGGVEHQHFNADPSVPCKWVAFIYLPWWDALASNNQLTKDSPDWQAAGKPSQVGRIRQ